VVQDFDGLGIGMLAVLLAMGNLVFFLLDRLLERSLSGIIRKKK